MENWGKGGPKSYYHPSHFLGGEDRPRDAQNNGPFPEAFWSAGVLSGSRPYLLGPCQVSCPALACRRAGSSPRCHPSISSSTHGRRTLWPSWGPEDLSLEQMELKMEKRESNIEEPYVQVWDGSSHLLFYCMTLCVWVFCQHACLGRWLSQQSACQTSPRTQVWSPSVHLKSQVQLCTPWR